MEAIVNLLDLVQQDWGWSRFPRFRRATSQGLRKSLTMFEGSLEAKLPTIWRDGNGTARKKLGRGESQKREDAGARKGREVAKHCVFPVFCGSGGSKRRLAKAAGAETSGQIRHEKLHAVVARSTFGSQKCQNTSAADQFWKWRCRKSARRCGAKHIWKSKRTKHLRYGPVLKLRC